MKKNFIKPTLTIATLGVALCTYAAILNENGKAGATGSPGEVNCSGCHGSSNTGAGSLNITTNIPEEGYTSGTTYQINITVSQPKTSLFGFGFEALNAANLNAGTLSITNAIETRLATVNSKTNVIHKLDGGKTSSMLGSKVFSFNWKAPDTNIGNVTFYTSAVAANGNIEKDDGDLVYTKSEVIKPANPAAALDAEGSNKLIINVFPNPAQKSVSVKYETKNAGKVTIEINDVNGKLVEVLLNEHAASGSHVNNFDLGNKYTAGVYFIKIKTAEQTSGQMLVIE